MFGVGSGDWGDDMPFGIDEEVPDEEPYLEEIVVKRIGKYNPNYGDHRICKCDHSYYRHFDSYEEMYACGCKYCQCDRFEEREDDEKDTSNLYDNND
jgi:hypothetical protein